MPELPEVEVVRRGLGPFVTGARVGNVRVLHERAVRRNDGDFSGELTGAEIMHVSRRGKYLWLVTNGDIAVVIHLGMSGQLRIRTPHDADAPDTDAPDTARHPHLRLRFTLTDSQGEATWLDFLDQRTFGGMYLSPLVRVQREKIPESILHIARDPLDPYFSFEQFSLKLRAKKTEVKRALLDQSLISGVGNIYADEALWRSRLHGTSQTGKLSDVMVEELVHNVKEVMHEALEQGGTSFDSLYVNVNGESGYFSRNLNVYGRESEPCDRCGFPIERVKFMNRSSFYCPSCQSIEQSIA